MTSSNSIRSKHSESKHQLELLLSAEACTLYKAQTGHSPDITDCRFLSEHELAFVFENFIIPIEQLFLAQGLRSLTKEVRQNIDTIFHQQLKMIVQRYTQRAIIDIMASSKLETGRKSIIFILAPDTVTI